MSRLLPCPACDRHVRSTERACPFCGAETPEAAPAALPPARRATSRAAILFASATLATGCGKETGSRDAGASATVDASSTEPVASSASPVWGRDFTPVPPYGASMPKPEPTASCGAASPAASAAAPTAITAQHVLVAYKGASKAAAGVVRTKAEAKKRAEEVAGKAKSGADFSGLVAVYSDDPAAKERQGSVGKFTRDKMAKPFSDAAFALRVDQTSEPVETPFGFHIIKRNQ